MENKYLEKIALRRIVSEFAKGTISTPLTSLVGKGFIKPEEKYLKGMIQGNSNISKQIGVKSIPAKTDFAKKMSAMGGGHVTYMDKNRNIRVRHQAYKNDDIGREAFKRHEYFEVMDMKQAIKNPQRQNIVSKENADHIIKFFGNKHIGKNVANFKTPKPDLFLNNGQLVGSHMSPRVLTRESEMVRRNPHLVQGMSKMRGFTGENKFIEKITGKRYGQDKMTSKDHRKAFAMSETNKGSAYPAGYADHKI